MAELSYLLWRGEMRYWRAVLQAGLVANSFMGLAVGGDAQAAEPVPAGRIVAVRALLESTQADAIADSCIEGFLKGIIAREHDPAKVDTVAYAMDGVRYRYNQSRNMGDEILAGLLTDADLTYLKLFFGAPSTRKAMQVLGPTLADVCFTTISRAFSMPVEKGAEQKAAIDALTVELKGMTVKAMKGIRLSEDEKSYVFSNLESVTTQKFMGALSVEMGLRLGMAQLQEWKPARPQTH